MQTIKILCVGLALIAGLAALAVASSAVPQPGYSTTTLRDPVYDEVQVFKKVVQLNNWLNDNYASLAPQQFQGPREEAYYIIDSYVKDLYATDGVILPNGEDGVLEAAFSWVERLGVYGGNLVYNRVKRPGESARSATMQVPMSMVLELDGDMFVVTAKDRSWGFRVPYYFMIAGMQSVDRPGVPRSDMVMISTGTAAHTGQDGHSQATIVYMYGPGADPEEFAQFCRSSFGFGAETESLTAGSAELKSDHVHDPDTHMHRELVMWDAPAGVTAVVYMGLDGTYEWNRVHFGEFLDSVVSPQAGD